MNMVQEKVKDIEELYKVEEAILIPTTPLNFDATFHKPDHFPSNDNYWEPGIRWQTWAWKGKQLGLKFINRGRINISRGWKN